MQVWDLGGQTSIRPYWRCYYQNTNAIIYVVDSADAERMGISKQELVTMLEEEELKEQNLHDGIDPTDDQQQVGVVKSVGERRVEETKMMKFLMTIGITRNVSVKFEF